MAIITETSEDFTDSKAPTDARISFVVLAENDPKAIAVAEANGREVPIPKDRVFVETVLVPKRSDGRDGGFPRVSEMQHVDSSNYAGIDVSALFSALKIIHDVDRVRGNLAP